MKILCCGFFPALQRTLHFTELQYGEVNRANSVLSSVGGKASNSARAIKRLGGNPLLMSFIGGYIGMIIKNLLDEEGIKYEFIETDNETRICQTLLVENEADFTELVEDIPALSAKYWKQLLKVFKNVENEYGRIIFSGTLRKNAPTDIYAELISFTQPEKVILDTSGEPLLAALEHSPALIKINKSELMHTLRADIDDTEELARELIARGAGAVGITEGGSSAMLIMRDKTVRYKIPEVEVVNTLGCGDSVNAGIAYMLEVGKSLPEAFAFGLACGTANAMSTMPGMIEIDDVSNIVKSLSVV